MYTNLRPAYKVNEVTTEWLEQALREARLINGDKITHLEYSACGTGQLADSYRFSISYDRPSSGPKTVVAKFPSEDPTSREFARANGFYKSEIEFYQTIRPGLDLSAPVALFAALDANECDFMLVMEDIGETRSVDQNAGCTPDDAANVVRQAAMLHAGSWGNKKLQQVPWLKSIGSAFVQVTENFSDITNMFRSNFGDVVSEECFQVAEKSLSASRAWIDVLQRPVCLWHSDFRADNLLFDAGNQNGLVTVLDWQTLGYGSGTIDMSHFLTLSLETEVRRQHEEGLVKEYHEALVSNGVEGYSLEECWQDYRVNSLYSLQSGIFAANQVKRTPRGDEMWRIWVERATVQVQDHDTIELLTRRR
ncbi:oxidoreductase family protein [Nocardia alni]|uniref:oxidoreductase family protein n=1 Tax=Nocardia alni TaxID=2815723 RepID=UPI001C244584|nr:oxidoreductase family protein [Nocardia alni]